MKALCKLKSVQMRRDINSQGQTLTQKQTERKCSFITWAYGGFNLFSFSLPNIRDASWYCVWNTLSFEILRAGEFVKH